MTKPKPKPTKPNPTPSSYPKERASPRLNTTLATLKQLKKQGLKPHKLTVHPDGSTEFVLAGEVEEG